MGVKASLLSRESFQKRDRRSGVEAIDSKEGRQGASGMDYLPPLRRDGLRAGSRLEERT